MTENDLKEYVEFIEQTIEEIKKTISLFNNDTNEIRPEQINDVLGQYYGKSTWLISMYEQESIQYKSLCQDYKSWWAEKYREASRKINADRTKSKFASSGEIEAETIHDNKEEYDLKNKEMIIKERRVSLFKHLMENWKDILSTCITLSSNSRADMKSLGLERIYNKPKKRKTPIEE